jgi:hypothetical protein
VFITNQRKLTTVSVCALTLAVTSLLVVSPTLTEARNSNTTPIGDFKNIPPIILQNAKGKQYKIDIDCVQDAGFVSGEQVTYKNHHARGNTVDVRRGEQITLTYGAPLGYNDLIRASLLKGIVTAQEGPNGFVKLIGQNTIFLTDYSADGVSQGQIPSNVKRGSYELVVLMAYNEALHGYYVTHIRVG